MCLITSVCVCNIALLSAKRSPMTHPRTTDHALHIIIWHRTRTSKSKSKKETKSKTRQPSCELHTRYTIGPMPPITSSVPARKKRVWLLYAYSDCRVCIDLGYAILIHGNDTKRVSNSSLVSFPVCEGTWRAMSSTLTAVLSRALVAHSIYTCVPRSKQPVP